MVSKTLKYLNIPALEQEVIPGESQDAGQRWARETAPPEPKDLTVMPDLKGLTLREALTRLKSSRARVQVSGSGIVVTQDPGAGKRIGSAVSLKLLPRATG
jgi:hypothetical protein